MKTFKLVLLAIAFVLVNSSNSHNDEKFGLQVLEYFESTVLGAIKEMIKHHFAVHERNI